MRHVRKLLAVVMLFSTVMLLSACGGKEQSVTYYNKLEQEGVILEEWITLHAKGDKVESVGDTMIIDYSSLDAATQETMVTIYDQMLEAYKAIEGVECTGGAEEGQYTIDFYFAAEKEILDTLSEQGLFAVEGSTEGISLKASQQTLEGSGYTVAER